MNGYIYIFFGRISHIISLTNVFGIVRPWQSAHYMHTCLQVEHLITLLGFDDGFDSLFYLVTV